VQKIYWVSGKDGSRPYQTKWSSTCLEDDDEEEEGNDDDDEYFPTNNP